MQRGQEAERVGRAARDPGGVALGVAVRGKQTLSWDRMGLTRSLVAVHMSPPHDDRASVHLESWIGGSEDNTGTGTGASLFFDLFSGHDSRGFGTYGLTVDL